MTADVSAPLPTPVCRLPGPTGRPGKWTCSKWVPSKVFRPRLGLSVGYGPCLLCELWTVGKGRGRTGSLKDLEGKTTRSTTGTLCSAGKSPGVGGTGYRQKTPDLQWGNPNSLVLRYLPVFKGTRREVFGRSPVSCTESVKPLFP